MSMAVVQIDLATTGFHSGHLKPVFEILSYRLAHTTFFYTVFAIVTCTLQIYHVIYAPDYMNLFFDAPQVGRKERNKNGRFFSDQII